MSSVDNPGLIGIEYCGENYCSVNFKLNRKVEINTLPDFPWKSSIGSTLCGNCFVDSRIWIFASLSSKQSDGL